MCIIIVKPKKEKLNYKHIKNANGHNKDGFGVVSYTKKTGLQLFKTSDYETFVDKLKEWEDRKLVIHMRALSAGALSENNIQPLSIGKDGYFCHNGTIFGLVGDKEYSDSYIMAKTLGQLPEGEARDTMLELALGHDRAALMNAKGDIKTFGMWEEVEGCMYSSDYWKECDIDFLREDPSIPGTVRVAVYGTLKGGYGNHSLLAGSTFVGYGRTVNKYPMIDGLFPYAYEEEGVGYNLSVEVYDVTLDVMDRLDNLEGVEYDHYYPTEVDIKLDTGKIVTAEMYFACASRDKDEELIDEWGEYEDTF